METENKFNLYNDIRKRTNGEIYLGVVGADGKIDVYQTFYGRDGHS